MDHYKPCLSKHYHLHQIQHVTYTEGNKATLWSKGSIEKRLQDRKQNHYPGMSSLLVTDLLKGVYTTEKFGSGPLKKAVRTHNFCKETLEFPQGHEGRLQGRLHDREKMERIRQKLERFQ